MNKNGDKVHIHMWIYNLHNFNLPYASFKKDVTSGLQKLNGISKRNEFGVKFVPCFDNIDRSIRDTNYSNQVIIDYVANRHYDTLMNYFSTKNDKNFIYFY
jgi:hypothetical protein